MIRALEWLIGVYMALAFGLAVLAGLIIVFGWPVALVWLVVRMVRQ
jgi:4-hydroxybenzoate polyprenyltransferase